MKPHKYPRQEEVDFIDLGQAKAAVVEITSENRDYLLEMVMQTYLDDVCRYCGRNFTREELNTAVWAPGENGRIAHKECWDNHE